MVSLAPLLVFDSGVGGLSVLAEIKALLPALPIVYAADNAGFPYGDKSEAELGARVPALLGRLAERYQPCLAVIACNTASTIALSIVRSVLRLEVVGTVPALKPAALATQTGVIGVLGTPATVRQAYVDQLEAEFASHCVVLRHGTVELVKLAEAKLRGEATRKDAYAASLAGLLDQPGAEQMDTIVLACTHFPLVRSELAAALHPRNFSWIDSGAGIARRVSVLLERQGLRAAAAAEPFDAIAGRAVFTQASPEIEALRPALARRGLSTIEIL
jgi:glutamate racemase